MSGINTYSGLTTISGGTISISATENLGNGAGTNLLLFNSGTLRTTAVRHLITAHAGFTTQLALEVSA